MTSAIVQNQDRRCELCGDYAITDHHIQHRSMGGDDHDHNLIVLCPDCHSRTHAEKFGGPTLDITKDGEGLRVVDRASGEVLLDRATPPEGFNLPQWIYRFQKGPGLLRRAAQVYFRYLSEEQMIEVAHVLDELDEENWLAKATLLRIAKLRIPWGERKEKWEAIVQAFGLEKSQGYKLVKAADLWEQDADFRSTGNISPPHPDVILLAHTKGDPIAAMELYDDRKAQNPRYSLTQFKEDLKQGKTSMDPEPEYCVGHCIDCGRGLAPHVKADTAIAEMLKLVYRVLHKLRSADENR